MIDYKDGPIPSPLIMLTCIALRHALMEWQKDKGVHPNASNSKLQADRPDRSIYINYNNDGDKNASCSAATGHKLLTSPGIAVTYTFLMDTWNTLPESDHQRVYKNTPVTVKHQIHLAENPTPARVISVEAARVHNDIHLDNLTSEVGFEQPGIGSTDRNIPIDNNCTDDKLHIGMTGGSKDYEDGGDENDKCGAIPTASFQGRLTTELERLDLGTSDVDGYRGNNGDDADADEQEDTSLADAESMQHVED